VSADTPYSRLLEWAAVQVGLQIDAAVENNLRSVAQSVRQSPAVKEHVCGLEYHHDGSSRVDFFLACLSSLCCFDGLSLPPWWEALLAACDPIDLDYALQGGLFVQDRIGQLAAVPMRSHDVTTVLPDAHSLEFDHDAQGTRLAGVFQWIYPPAHKGGLEPPDQDLWKATWERLPLGGCLRQPSTWRDGLLEQVRQLLGWPVWAGFMCGRGNLLKLGFHLDAPLLERLPQFLRDKGLADDGAGYLAALTGCIRDPHDEVRISLDLDLAAQQLLPSLALEYYPALVTAETQTWQVLDHLQNHVDLEPAVVSDARRQLSCLPFGKRPSVSSLALQQLMPALPVAAARAAKLSHYKLSQEPGRPWKLKSYLSLTWSYQ
jgi:hypothetical protein